MKAGHLAGEGAHSTALSCPASWSPGPRLPSAGRTVGAEVSMLGMRPLTEQWDSVGQCAALECGEAQMIRADL